MMPNGVYHILCQWPTCIMTSCIWVGVKIQLRSIKTRYMHAHHVPHAEHVERSDEMVKRSRDDVEDFEDMSGTPCCPPPVLFIAQRAKLSRVFNGQNYL